jgi:hypothetical protein
LALQGDHRPTFDKSLSWKVHAVEVRPMRFSSRGLFQQSAASAAWEKWEKGSGLAFCPRLIYIWMI